MNFSELMHKERKLQRITLRTLSEKTGIKFSTLADIDAGRIKDPPDTYKGLIGCVLGAKLWQDS